MIPRDPVLFGLGTVIIHGEGGGGGSATKLKITGPKLFLPPPRQDRIQDPTFKGWKIFAPPLHSSMAKTMHSVLKLPQHLLCPPPPRPSAWLTLFPNPLFGGVRIHLPLFCPSPKLMTCPLNSLTFRIDWMKNEVR